VALRDAAGNLIPNSAATAISGDGAWVFGGGRDGTSMFRWNRATRAVDYFTILSGGEGREFFDASRDGSAVVGNLTGQDVVSKAFRWTSDGGAVSLLGLAGFAWTQARGVSRDGSVVIGNAFGENSSAAVRWRGGGEPQRLATPAGYEFVTTQGASPSGDFIPGMAQNLDFETVALLWRGDDDPLVFGPPPGGTGVGAVAVSDTGVLAGMSDRPDAGGSHAALWDAQHGARWLSDVLVENGIDVRGWRFLTVSAISADGLTLVGDGTGPRGETSFIAVLPEPGAAALAVAFSSLGLLRRRRR